MTSLITYRPLWNLNDGDVILIEGVDVITYRPLWNLNSTTTQIDEFEQFHYI